MNRIRKRLGALAVASALMISVAGPAPAQRADEAERLESLLAELAEPGRTDWARIEAEVVRIWSQSGSDAMDMLLRRGNEALEAEDYGAAVEHLTALTDHAPEFAEGWNARATAFFLMEEYSLALADIRRVLALNPQHFGALSGLGVMLEQMGETDLALRAARAAREIHPNRPNFDETVERLERMTGAAEL